MYRAVAFITVAKRFRDIYVEVRHVRKIRSTVATRLRIAVSLCKNGVSSMISIQEQSFVQNK